MNARYYVRVRSRGRDWWTDSSHRTLEAAEREANRLAMIADEGVPRYAAVCVMYRGDTLYTVTREARA